MNEPIEPDLLGPERLVNESARAYRAFCIYRDLGPDRSLDRAWQRFCTDQQKERGAGRRPGQWASWATRFQWVDRADACDDLIDQEKRAADAESRRQLQADRARFEREDHARMEKLVLTIDNTVDRLATASLAEVTIQKYDKVEAKRTTTKVKALRAQDVAVLTKARNDAARQIIEGYAPKDKDTVRDERRIDRIVWVPAKKKAA